MALPTQITVRGTLLDVNGGPAKGQITFQSSVSALDSGSETVVIPSSKYVTLDLTGSFSVTLPASDDPLWTPVGWTYNVIVRVDDNKSSFRTVIPYDAPGGEIWFSELTPALDGGSELYAAFSHTHAGSGGGSVTWTEITGKPTTFPPSAHTHDDRYFTESETTTLLAGKANTVHTHTKSEVGLGNVDDTSDASKPISTLTQAALDGKAAVSHAHAISDVTNLQTTLDGKAASSHTHTISNVTGLQTALDGKADDSEITSLDSRLDSVELRTQIIVLGPSDPVPGGTPAGTVIVRTA